MLNTDCKYFPSPNQPPSKASSSFFLLLLFFLNQPHLAALRLPQPIPEAHTRSRALAHEHARPIASRDIRELSTSHKAASMAPRRKALKRAIVILSSSEDSSPVLAPTLLGSKSRLRRAGKSIDTTKASSSRAHPRSGLKDMSLSQMNNQHVNPGTEYSDVPDFSLSDNDMQWMEAISPESQDFNRLAFTLEPQHLPNYPTLAPRPSTDQMADTSPSRKRKSPTTVLPASKRPATVSPDQTHMSISPVKGYLSISSSPSSPSSSEDRPPRSLTAKPFSLSDLIDNIPLTDRAPVGRRRLIRKKVLEDSDDEVDEPGDMTREEQIESDRIMVEEAARRLGCKRTWVSVTRKEEVGGEVKKEVKDEVREEVRQMKEDENENENRDDVEEPEIKPDIKGKGKAKFIPKSNPGGGLLDTFLNESSDPDSDSDSDMVLRRPGTALPQKKKPGKTLKNPIQNPLDPNKVAVPGVNDDMEWICGGDLGQRDSGRKFKDVTEKKLMWRVPGMLTSLLIHQVLGVDWMMARELGKGRPRGGLVADAMGLGKTIQSIATMVLNPALPATVITDPTVTLIVAPVALLQQWKGELTQHAKANNFNIHIHHGRDKLNSVSALRKYDVVIASYGAICNSYPSTRKPKQDGRMTQEEEEIWWEQMWRTRGIFHCVKFWRVILDESHILKNRLSRTSLACQTLDAVHTWALSGTPIQNTLDDIYPIFRFMRHPHVGDLNQFRAVTQGGGEGAAKRVQAVLRGCMMRRMKKDQLMGKDLVCLQKKRVRMIELEFGEEERVLYQCVEEMSRETMNKYIREGTVMKNYSDVLVMLLRLRQICDHPYLILTTINKTFTVADLDRALPAETGLGAKSGLRQILDAARVVAMGDITECSICLDSPEAPVITTCRHIFCRDCITNHITGCARTGVAAACPLCKTNVSPDDLTNYRANTPDDVLTDRKRTKKQENDEWLADAGAFTHSAKTLALRDQLLEWRENHPGDKVVLFSQFTKMLDIVEHVLEDEGWNTVRYQGGMTLSEREEALATFRGDPDCWVMLTSLRAGGVGLNLVNANLVLSLDLWWNGAVELQAFDRVHRMGQKKEVFVSRFIVKNTVEQRILDLQQQKEKISSAALGDGVATNLGKLTQHELMGLFGRVVGGPGGMRIIADGSV